MRNVPVPFLHKRCLSLVPTPFAFPSFRAYEAQTSGFFGSALCRYLGTAEYREFRTDQESRSSRMGLPLWAYSCVHVPPNLDAGVCLFR